MSRASKGLFAVLALAIGFAAPAKAGKNSWEDYIGQYAKPEFFQDNNVALASRLRLLDNALPGSKARILTFLFDNGVSTRTLAAHMCKAARRGVEVRFIADSKAGGRVGQHDAFDNNPHHLVNEETYQYLANCGVKVRIFNFLPEFYSFFGKRIPKLGQSSLVSTAYHIYLFRKILVDEIIAAFEAKNIKLTKRELKDILTKLIKVKALLGEEVDTAAVNDALAALEEILHGTLMRAFSGHSGDEISAVLGAALDRVQQRVNDHPDLRKGYEAARKFNRLNHRKLFLVDDAQKQGCMFLGGRNLGDHYLTWQDKGDNFVDSDVFFCSQHEEQAWQQTTLDAARESFDELWNNIDVSEKIFPTPTHMFWYIRFPANHPDASLAKVMIRAKEGTPFGMVPPGQVGANEYDSWKVRLRVNEAALKLPITDRTIPIVPDSPRMAMAIHGVELANGYNWRVLRSTWDKNHDHVRAALYRAIDREQKQIYIETAYAEMDDEFRTKIEAALERGVDVTLITNSAFTSDGPSKLIRFLMAAWTKELLDKHGNAAAMRAVGEGTFRYFVSSIHGGHMIHFKGAGFRCQATPTKEGIRYHKTFLIGSHNFHPRSGHTDQEHAIFWDEPADGLCAPAKTTGRIRDLIDMRAEHYSELGRRISTKFLMPYDSLYYELSDSIASGKLQGERKQRAEALLAALYELPAPPPPEQPRLKGGERFLRVLKVLRDAGIHELMGTVF